jgi:hypothetical protein
MLRTSCDLLLLVIASQFIAMGADPKPQTKNQGQRTELLIGIEDTAEWLRYEMKLRKFDKPLVISDTTPAPFIAWGPATRATGPASTLGLVVQPAIESDRPRLAKFFTKLVDGDKATEEWTHAFVAADMVKKITVAAEQQILLIDTSFMEDLHPFKLKLAAGGAGISAWAGMGDLKLNILDQSRSVLRLRPAFYAIQQIQRHIRGYDKVERVQVEDKRVRVYRFDRDKSATFVIWLEPEKLLLPDDAVPSATISLRIGGGGATVERMIEEAGQTKPERQTVTANAGTVRLTVTPTPVFVLP